MNQHIIEILSGVRTCVTQAAGVIPKEKVICLTDWHIDPIVAQTFAGVCKDIGAEATIINMRPPVYPNEEPPDVVVVAVCAVDVIFGITTYSQFHTKALWRAKMEYGARLINVPPPQLVSLASDAAKVDLNLITKITRRNQDKMRKGRTYKVTSENGTDFTAIVEPWDIGGGSSRVPKRAGEFLVFPSGANSNHSLFGSCEGIVVLDAVDGFEGVLRTHVKYTVKKSLVEKVEGGMEADWIKEKIRTLPRANEFEELSIGMNPRVPLIKALDAKWHAFAHRTAGAVHVAIGTEPYFHLDGMIFEPTVKCVESGETLVEKGWLTVLDEPDIKSDLEKFNIVPSRI